MSDVEPAVAVPFQEAVGAVVDGDAIVLRRLLDAHPGLATAHSTEAHGASLLHYNAANGVEDELQRTPENAVEIAELLISAGADINLTASVYGGGAGSTPLVGLVTSGHPQAAGLMDELVRAYARSGQSLDGIDGDGLPMSLAFRFRHPNAARVLAECGASVGNVALAAGLGRSDAVLAMVECGTPPTADPRGLAHFSGEQCSPEVAVQMALYYASISGESEVVSQLISCGVDVNARLDHGMTALHEAAWMGHESVVRILLDAGARADLRESQFGATAVGWAAHSGHSAIAKLLHGHSAGE